MVICGHKITSSVDSADVIAVSVGMCHQIFSMWIDISVIKFYKCVAGCAHGLRVLNTVSVTPYIIPTADHVL